MKNEMEEIDALIKETLNEEESKFYDSLEEQNLFEMLFGLFRGKNAWINILLNIVIMITFIIFIYCGIQFFNAETTNELIKWGLGSLTLLLSISMMKLYAFMQMDKNAILREIKRLELLVISQSSK